ncbi:MAG: DUF4214 domain-containing protein [Lachnospiraceae bacterium]|nr:DUF4214 domain-containing protein [Lachnospiraceae bacterium]
MNGKSFRMHLRRAWGLFLSLVLVLGCIGAMPMKAKAAQNVTLTVSFQGTSYTPEKGAVEYSVDNGAHWERITTAGDTAIVYEDSTRLRIRIAPGQGYGIDWTATRFQIDEEAEIALKDDTSNIKDGLSSGDGYIIDRLGYTTVKLNGVEFHEGGGVDPGQGGGQPGPGGDDFAVITMHSGGLTWTGIPMVYEDWFQYNEDGTIDWDASDSWQRCTISLNENGERADFYHDDNVSNTDEIRYAAKEGQTQGQETVDVTFECNWSDRFVDVVNINGTEYDIKQRSGLDYDNRRSWLEHFSFEYHNQSISFTIPDVPANIGDDGKAHLDITVDLRPITEPECFIGNFLWSADPAREGDDIYIGNSQVELIKVTYPESEGGDVFDAETLAAESQLPRDQKSAEYVTYGKDNSTDFENGEMVLPEGSWVTMKIYPEYGHQVVAFHVNGTDVRAEQDPGVFSFKIGKGNFHIGAEVAPVEDEVRAEAQSVSGGGITIGGGEMNGGTARLDVGDASVSEAQIASFENAAEGMQVGEILDISLFNTVYQGSAEHTWDTPVNNLNADATVTLELEEAPAGEEVAVIHEKHDGTFETIPAEYDPETKTVSFRTKSFSNFAIATRGQADPTAVNEAAAGGFLGNLYQLTLGREPDAEGAEYWMNRLTSREVCATELVFGFLNSPEYKAKEKTDEEYVQELYRIFLQREADAEGLAYWTGMLAQGTSRDAVAAGFANSAEFTGCCEEMNIAQGTVEPDGTVVYTPLVFLFVQNCYDVTLGRWGEGSGVNYWSYLLNKGQMDFRGVAEFFVHSEEFTAKNLDDGAYVTVLYQMFLGRTPDADGLAYWTGVLERQELTRDDLLTGFADSPEFEALIAQFGQG